jgi:hypothetical protein
MVVLAPTFDAVMPKGFFWVSMRWFIGGAHGKESFNHPIGSIIIFHYDK